VDTQTGAPAATTDLSADFVIGKSNGTSFGTGNIGDVSIYNTEKAAVEVAAIYNSGVPKDESATPGLGGYWRLGDTAYSGGTGDIWIIPDSSGNGNDGNSVGMALDSRVGNAPGSSGNTISYGMTINSRTTDVPT